MPSKKETVAQWFEQYSNDIYHFLIYRTHVNDAEDGSEYLFEQIPWHMTKQELIKEGQLPAEFESDIYVEGKIILILVQ